MTEYTSREALEAIRARIQGVWDHPALVALGPLFPSATDDILRILDTPRRADPDSATLAALRALVDWGREHTSPTDPNSPHALLVAGAEAIAAATD